MPNESDTLLINNYRQQHDKAMAAIADYTLSEESYKTVLTPLYTMDQWMQSVGVIPGDQDAEAMFLEIYYPDAHNRPLSPTQLLGILDEKHQTLSKEFALANYRDKIPVQRVYDQFVLPEGEPAPEIGSGAGWKKPQPLAKLDMLLAYLLEKKIIHTDDFQVFEGRKPDASSVRQTPYRLIDLPRYGAQIAVCDQNPAATFVGQLPRWSDWAVKNSELRADPRVEDVGYTQNDAWLVKIAQLVQQADSGQLLNLDNTEKVTIPKAGKKPLLSRPIIAAWMQLFWEHAKETTGVGRYPSSLDKEVWQRTADGGWAVLPEEKWFSLQSAGVDGSRGLNKGDTLVSIKKEYGFGKLTKAMIADWMQLFWEHAKETTGVGRYPSRDKEVWQRTADGGWAVLPEENWSALDLAGRNVSRGLNKGDTLASIKGEYGFQNESAQHPLAAEITATLQQTAPEDWPDQLYSDQDTPLYVHDILQQNYEAVRHVLEAGYARWHPYEEGFDRGHKLYWNPETLAESCTYLQQVQVSMAQTRLRV